MLKRCFICDLSYVDGKPFSTHLRACRKKYQKLKRQFSVFSEESEEPRRKTRSHSFLTDNMKNSVNSNIWVTVFFFSYIPSHINMTVCLNSVPVFWHVLPLQNYLTPCPQTVNIYPAFSKEIKFVIVEQNKLYIKGNLNFILKIDIGNDCLFFFF